MRYRTMRLSYNRSKPRTLARGGMAIG